MRRRLERLRGTLSRDPLQPGSRRGGAIPFVCEQSDQLFFVYTGAAQRLGIDPRAFFKSTRLFERNVAMFRDERNAFYQHGLSAEIDSFEALLDWHHEFRARLAHVRRVFCLGTSMGAYTALLFGRLLDAEQVWAFGPPVTRLEGEGLDGLPGDRGDLAALLARPNGVTTYHVHYCDGCESDRLAAGRIASCDGVRLHPHPGDVHNVVTVMAGQRLLETVLPEPTP